MSQLTPLDRNASNGWKSGRVLNKSKKLLDKAKKEALNAFTKKDLDELDALIVKTPSIVNFTFEDGVPFSIFNKQNSFSLQLN